MDERNHQDSSRLWLGTGESGIEYERRISKG